MFGRGFSLVESMLVLAIISILVGVGVPLGRHYLARNDLYVAKTMIISGLDLARQYSLDQRLDDIWSVHFETGGMVVYKGDNYAGRDPSFDQVYVISGAINFSGDTNISFSDSLPLVSDHTINLVTQAAGSEMVSVNRFGVVE